jgi:hypothetical protein
MQATRMRMQNICMHNSGSAMQATRMRSSDSAMQTICKHTSGLAMQATRMRSSDSTLHSLKWPSASVCSTKARNSVFGRIFKRTNI